MELRQLRSFIAAAEDGNISRAAQRLRLTQPGLSRQIKSLEDEMGVPLLERSAHSFTLTPAGELLLREGRVLLERADALEHRVRATVKAQAIRLGYAPSLSAGILAPAIEALSQMHPKVRVELHDLTNDEMMEGLQKGLLDVIVTIAPLKTTADTQWTTLQQQSWRVAVPRQHALSTRALITPQDLNGQRFVIYNQRDYPDYWAVVREWLGQQQIVGRIASEVDGVSSLVSAVDAGLGLAIVVDRLACLIPDRIVLKPLMPQPPPVCIAAGISAAKKQDKILGVLIEELKRAADVPGARGAQGEGPSWPPLHP